jgi:hypothetical protein
MVRYAKKKPTTSGPGAIEAILEGGERVEVRPVGPRADATKIDRA